MLEIDRSADTRRIELDGGSWVDLTRAFVPEATRVLDEVFDAVTWQRTEVWRYDRFVEEQRLGAWIRPDDLPTALRQTGLHLDAGYRVRFSGVSVVHYRDGEDFQGLHRDQEMRWLDETLIGILVLGARRPFVLRPAGVARRDASADVVLDPGEGDLLVLGGRAQRDWLHGVPRAPGVTAPRVSVIWRWTSRRGRPHSGATYYDGRHYSDAPGARATRSRPAGAP